MRNLQLAALLPMAVHQHCAARLAGHVPPAQLHWWQLVLHTCMWTMRSVGMCLPLIKSIIRGSQPRESLPCTRSPAVAWLQSTLHRAQDLGLGHECGKWVAAWCCRSLVLWQLQLQLTFLHCKPPVGMAARLDGSTWWMMHAAGNSC